MKTALIFALCLTAFGQEQAPKMPRKTEGTSVSKPAVVDFYDSLSDYFRQSSRAVQALNQKGIPDEELAALLYIARHSSASPNELVAAKKIGNDWAGIAKNNKVSIPGTINPGKDFATEANIIFLSEYHGRKPEDVRAMHAKGASFVAINQEFRRGGTPMKRKTEK